MIEETKGAFSKPSLITRITIGKFIGIVAGIVYAIAFLQFYDGGGWQFLAGLVFWYTFFGAVIGLGGTMTWHPIAKFPLPWWIRGPLYGAVMNLALVLLTFPYIQQLFLTGPEWMPFTNPYWLIVDGVFLGLFIDGFATLYGGDGPKTVDARLERRA